MSENASTAITACPVDDEGGVCGRDDCGRCGCDCLVPWLDGAGNHSPGCRIFRGRKNGS